MSGHPRYVDSARYEWDMVAGLMTTGEGCKLKKFGARP